MPNDQVWGQNGQPTQHGDQDLVSLGNEIIEVADIEDDSRIALKASNKDGVSSVALRAEGKVEIVAVSEGNPVSTGLHVTNESTHVDARALRVDGKTILNNDTGIIGKLGVAGNVELSDYGCLKINDVNFEHEDRKALYTANSSAHADARALQALGMSEIVARSGGEPVSIGLKVTNAHDAEGSLAIHVSEGKSKFEGQLEIPDLVEGVTALSVTNTHHEGKALDINGISQFRGEITGISDVTCKTSVIINDIDSNFSTIETTNSYNGVDARALKASGMVEVIGNSEGNPATTGLLVKNSSTHADARALKAEGNVEIVGQEGNLRKLILNWAALEAESGQTLKIGTENTDGVAIQADGLVKILGDQNTTGSIKVGTMIVEGKIDAGHSGQNLSIGTDVDFTKDVVLSRDGQITDIMGKTRLNKNDLVLNDADSVDSAVIPLGCGMKFNSAGHGFGASIDFYTDGVFRAYVDSTGFNNA